MQEVQTVRRDRYSLLSALFPGARGADPGALELRAVTVPEEARTVAWPIRDLGLEELGVTVTALTRGEERVDSPSPDTRIEAGDVVLLSGPATALDRAEVKAIRG